jgi:hypothetical protein
MAWGCELLVLRRAILTPGYQLPLLRSSRIVVIDQNVRASQDVAEQENSGTHRFTKPDALLVLAPENARTSPGLPNYGAPDMHPNRGGAIPRNGTLLHEHVGNPLGRSSVPQIGARSLFVAPRQDSLELFPQRIG